jgi:mannose/fructose/sorbose-specific phosphotransferase system IIA component
MTGVVVVTHGEAGKALLATVEGILGPQQAAAAYALSPGMGLEDLTAPLKAVVEANGADGTLILTDLFGGTPCNAGLSLCADPRVEVVAGVSLPVLIEALSLRGSLPLPELALAVVDRGREGLVAASALLRQRK